MRRPNQIPKMTSDTMLRTKLIPSSATSLDIKLKTLK
jgi:hypothetical protein